LATDPAPSGAEPAATPAQSTLAQQTRPALFLAFLKMGLLGFGGVLPWARRVLVDERGWMTDREFAELIGMCQIMPGPNVVNLSVIIGARAQGPLGALLALTGILFFPVCVLLIIAVSYATVSHDPTVRSAFAAASAAAAGLILGTALRLLMHTRPAARGLCTGAAAFVMIGVLQWPLLWVLPALIAVALALEWRAAR